jgi:hypothetical protein
MIAAPSLNFYRPSKSVFFFSHYDFYKGHTKASDMAKLLKFKLRRD